MPKKTSTTKKTSTPKKTSTRDQRAPKSPASPAGALSPSQISNLKSQIPGPTTLPYLIPIDQIQIHPDNPRKHFDGQALDELAKSIAEVGVLQPVLLRPLPSQISNFKSQISDPEPSSPSSSPVPRPLPQYQLVIGERRFRAAIKAGLAGIPATVHDLSDTQALEAMTVENLQREDVHPLEEATGYKTLQTKAGYDVPTLAAKIGKSEEYVYARLKLLALTASAQKAFLDGSFSASHAILIARLSPNAQKQCLQELSEEPGMSHRAFASFIQREVVLALPRALFDVRDPLLISKAGACTECPKNTACDLLGTLFEDNEKPDPAKGECTDLVCWKNKLSAHFGQRAAKIADETGVKPLRVSGCTRQTAGDLLGYRDFTQAKEGAPGAVPALIVETSTYSAGLKGQPGELVFVVLNSSKPAKSPDDQRETEKLRQAREKRKQAVMKEYKQALFAALSASVPTKIDETSFRVLLIRTVETVGYTEAFRSLHKLMGWDLPGGNGPADYVPAILKRLPALAEADLCRLAFVAPIASELILEGWQLTVKPRSMEALAAIAGVEHEKMLKEIEAKHPKIEKPKPPKPQAPKPNAQSPKPKTQTPDSPPPTSPTRPTRPTRPTSPTGPTSSTLPPGWTQWTSQNGPEPVAITDRISTLADARKVLARIASTADGFHLSFSELDPIGPAVGKCSFEDGSSLPFAPIAFADDKFQTLDWAIKAADAFFLTLDTPTPPTTPTSPTAPSHTSDTSHTSDPSDSPSQLSPLEADSYCLYDREFIAAVITEQAGVRCKLYRLVPESPAALHRKLPDDTNAFLSLEDETKFAGAEQAFAWADTRVEELRKQ